MKIACMKMQISNADKSRTQDADNIENVNRLLQRDEVMFFNMKIMKNNINVTKGKKASSWN
jgi:hypothetical protein